METNQKMMTKEDLGGVKVFREKRKNYLKMMKWSKCEIELFGMNLVRIIHHCPSLQSFGTLGPIYPPPSQEKRGTISSILAIFVFSMLYITVRAAITTAGRLPRQQQV